MREPGYIKKHLQYINYRVDQIAPRLTKDDGRTDSAALFSAIRYLSGGDALYPVGEPDERHFLDDLKRLVDRWDITADGDLLGYIYQRLKSARSKKILGQYFTPPDIVGYICNQTLNADRDLRTIKILDPACGSGQFLIAAFRVLAENYARQGVPAHQAARRIIAENLYGYDLDPVAVYISHFNLMRISGIKDYKIYNIHEFNYIFPQHRDHCSGATRFDVIIGNPPWGSAMDGPQKQQARKSYVSSKSGLNTFTLFIEKSLSLLADNGLMGFLIPEAYLNIRAHSASRSFMLRNACIENIAVWGERFKGVFAPSVSLVARRALSEESRTRSIVHVQHPLGTGSETATLIPQHHYQSTHEHIFNIHYTRKAVRILSKIDEQDCFYLNRRARFFLGIVTGNNPHYLSRTKSDEHPDPILRGRDLRQYQIQFSGTYFKYDPSNLQQVAPRECYEHRDKLLYKFIGRGLVFALDRGGMFSLNNINGLIPENIPVSPECLVALLNSRVLQYYYEKNFFTVKVLRGNLEKLPIKKITPGNQEKLHRLSVDLINSPAGPENELIRETIEDIICREYGIPDRAFFMLEGPKSAGGLSAGQPAAEE